jgi:ABC-2 type transport system permease protein
MTTQHRGARLLLVRDLRSDLRLILPWVAALTLMVLASAASIESLYPDVHDRLQAATALNDSPATVALYGPIVDASSAGELAMTKLTVLYAFVVALLPLVLVRRHTRGEEESGRTELVGATRLGRDAPLSAALMLGAVVSLATGALAAAVDAAAGLPVTGSLLFGASWAGIGLVATGLTAVACQVFASGRACAGLATGALGGLYLVRAVADVGPARVGWLTPFGWGTRLHAWSDPRWWVLLLYGGLSGGLAVSAYVLRGRRDLGSGLVATRPGPRSGSARLVGAGSLVWRLDRSALTWWTAGVAAMGTLFGLIAPGVDDMLDTDAGRRVIEQLGGTGKLEDMMLAAVVAMSGVLITCFGLMVLGRAGADEREARTEIVLATAVSRYRAFWSAVTLALAGVLWLLVVTGVTMGLGAGRGPTALLPAALAQWPAAAVVVAAASLAWGWRAAWVASGWAILVACLVLEAVGGLLDLPGWVQGLSPYAHVPAIPVEPQDPAATAALLVVTCALVAAGTVRYRGRDLD